MAEESVATATPEPATGIGAPEPAPSPASAPVADWRQQIPEAIRGEKTWEKFKDAGAFYQSYHAMEKAQGRMTAIPGPDAKPEELAAFHRKLGVPEKPEGYAPPEGVELDTARWSKWTAHAHALGLTPAQLNGLAALEAEERRHAGALTNQDHAEGNRQLIERWGQRLYDRNVTLASRAFLRFAPKELVDRVDRTGEGNDPLHLQAWAAVADLLGEHNFIDGRVEGQPGPEGAKQQIAEIRAQGFKHPANNPELPGHRQAAEALAELYKLAYGTDAAA